MPAGSKIMSRAYMEALVYNLLGSVSDLETPGMRSQAADKWRTMVLSSVGSCGGSPGVGSAGVSAKERERREERRGTHS